jgi:hypothetical protein
VTHGGRAERWLRAGCPFSVVAYNPAPVLTVQAAHPWSGAIEATSELLTKLKLESAFVGSVARSAWLGAPVGAGSIDVVATMTPEQKNNVAMMAGNRGFDVDRGEIERSEELDLIPLKFGDVRVHVLVASNALYGRMVKSASPASFNEREVRIASAEDLALLSLIGEDAETAGALLDMSGFDKPALNRKLVSIGLSGLVVHE